jgi:L-histidine Nalpha-methyltransferase
MGPGASLIELGSGSSAKTRILLRAMPALASYVPIDISADYLHDAVASLVNEFPALRVDPLVADFAQPFAIPLALSPDGETASPCLGFFPGSTIGNFAPPQAGVLLANLAQALGRGAYLLIGVDTTDNPALLLPAYDDARGVTAEFNLNLLSRINRELGGNFQLDQFSHAVRFDANLRRIEMHLVCERAQQVQVLGRTFDFTAGESIHTENAYKYAAPEFVRMALTADWPCLRSWRDPGASGFTVFLARCGDMLA